MADSKHLRVEPEIKKIVRYMKKTSSKDETSIYDNITGILTTVLTDGLRDNSDLAVVQFAGHALPDDETSESKKQTEEQQIQQIKLFDKLEENSEGGGDREEEFEIPLTDCCKMGNYFEKAGIGLGREETYRILLALRQLALECTFTNVRFWGKMYGIQANYFIVETEYREGEGDETDDLETLDSQELVYEEVEDEDGPIEDSSLPKPDWIEPIKIKKEKHHIGTNKYVYFVCNNLGEPWLRLPHVSPAEISTSRRITKLLTGNLKSTINSYPIFNGTEANYLRALVARISAGTQISPTGYFVFDDDDDGDEEEERDSFMLNADFEGLSPSQLAHSNMSNWVHNVQYILPQGRCTWFNALKVQPENDFEEEEEEEEDVLDISTETGPQLLSTVVSDEKICSHPAWSAYLSSNILPKYAVAIMRSNRWPGAFSFSNGKIFENIYIGWGFKYSSLCYNQEFPPTSYEEYGNHDEFTEVDDPSVEQESIFKELEEEANQSADEIDNLEDDDED